MAHADIFEKLSRETSLTKKQNTTSNNLDNKIESSIDKKAIETIKIIGKQLIEMKELVHEQSKLIDSLQDEVLKLKKRQTEAKGDIEMVVIDQKDVTKQLRTLKAIVTGEIHVNNRMQQDQVINTANTNLAQLPRNAYQEISPDAISKRFYNNYDHNPHFQTNTNEFNQQTRTLSSHSQQSQELALNQLQRAQSIQHKSGIDHSNHAESVAKEFIFGRIPKLLNLE
ncbi:MAG: hypothetical protein RLZZ361_210 [Cyanobacteriota bacterium]|jgi:hypothetical protein